MQPGQRDPRRPLAPGVAVCVGGDGTPPDRRAQVRPVTVPGREPAAFVPERPQRGITEAVVAGRGVQLDKRVPDPSRPVCETGEASAPLVGRSWPGPGIARVSTGSAD